MNYKNIISSFNEQEYEVFNFVEETAMCGDCRKCKNVCSFGAELLVKTLKVVP